jgi:hypothetical protein
MSAQGIDAGLPDPAERTGSVADRVGEPDGRSGRREGYRVRNTTFEGGFGSPYQASQGIAVAVLYQIRAHCPVRAFDSDLIGIRQGNGFPPDLCVCAGNETGFGHSGRSNKGEWPVQGHWRAINRWRSRAGTREDCSGATDGHLKRIGSFR